MTVLDSELDKYNVAAKLLDVILEMDESDQRHLLKTLTQPNNDERRNRPRKQCSIIVHYADDKKGVIKNISPAGAFIETQSPLTMGEHTLLTFPLVKTKKHIQVKGEIIRANNNSMGVHFLNSANS
jgi:PilZ domain-containing protein